MVLSPSCKSPSRPSVHRRWVGCTHRCRLAGPALRVGTRKGNPQAGAPKAPSPGPMGVAEFLSFSEGPGSGSCSERGGAPHRGRGRRALERGRCPSRGRANRRRARRGRGDQAFFPSARDQSGLYKLELLPPTDERARPRRYPAAPAPGPGAALTLPAPRPQTPPRPQARSLTLRDLVPKAVSISVVNVAGESTTSTLPTPISGVRRVNWGRGRRKHQP